MTNVVDIDDIMLEKNSFVIESEKLSEEIKKFLPNNSIPNNVIDYFCGVFIYNKRLEWNWMDKVDCYLGLPDYIENEEDLNKINYKVFPLTLVFDIVQQSMNDVRFSLRFESNIDNQVYFFHFNYTTFSEHLLAFEESMDNDFKGYIKKFTLKWKSLVKKIKDKPYKYADLRLDIQLSHYYNTTYKDNLIKSFFNVLIKEHFDFSIGQDYGVFEHYKKRGDFEELVEGYNFFDIPSLYEINNENSDNIIFKKLFPTLEIFALEFNQFHCMAEIDFDSDPTNHVVERELDFMNQIISNTNKRLLKKWAFKVND